MDLLEASYEKEAKINCLVLKTESTDRPLAVVLQPDYQPDGGVEQGEGGRGQEGQAHLARTEGEETQFHKTCNCRAKVQYSKF